MKNVNNMNNLELKKPLYVAVLLNVSNLNLSLEFFPTQNLNDHRRRIRI